MDASPSRRILPADQRNRQIIDVQVFFSSLLRFYCGRDSLTDSSTAVVLAPVSIKPKPLTGVVGEVPILSQYFMCSTVGPTDTCIDGPMSARTRLG